jgi:hypothetical protein
MLCSRLLQSIIRTREKPAHVQFWHQARCCDKACHSNLELNAGTWPNHTLARLPLFPSPHHHPEKGFLGIALAVLELWPLNSQRYVCLCLLSARIKKWAIRPSFLSLKKKKKNSKNQHTKYQVSLSLFWSMLPSSPSACLLWPQIRLSTSLSCDPIPSPPFFLKVAPF